MTTIDETRRNNLGILIAELGGNAELAKKLGKSDSQVTQWRRGSINSGTGKERGISAASCRKIEQAVGKPVGWMDKVHDDNEREVAEIVELYLSLEPRDRATAMTVLRTLAGNAAPKQG